MKKEAGSVHTPARQREAARRVAQAFFILCVFLLHFYQLQYSTIPNHHMLGLDPLIAAANVAVVAMPTLALGLIFGNWTVSLSIASVLCTLWSVANYFVVKYHGSPLLLNEFLHARDAFGVIGGYTFSFDRKLRNILLFAACELVCVVLIQLLHGKRGSIAVSRRLAWRASLLCADALLVGALLFSPAAVKPGGAIGWSMIETVQDYGFGACLVEDISNVLNPYTVPEGYAPERIHITVGADTAQIDSDMPDIVFILNETFYDLDVYTDVQADVDYLAPFYELDNAAFGQAFCPRIAGGTNDSEYELLTSNSVHLLNSYAPFNFLDLSAPGNSLPRYLKAFGYETWAMHPEPGENYSRNKGYPALGFDHVLLGEDSFPQYSLYGNREWLDWENYQDALAQYEAGGDGPRFLYLLTYQNHGGYEQNEASFDLVHTRADFGELTDDVNEYLTSLSLSAEAFRDLTEYLAQSERHVIVMMVGDHAPSFITEIPAREGEAQSVQTALNRQLVPYVIWSNYEMDVPHDVNCATMTDLGPMVLKLAGVPLSAYYREILELHEAFPIRTATGIYVDAEGEIGEFEADNPEHERVRQYYYMEYNSLKGGSEYRAELFQPAGF